MLRIAYIVQKLILKMFNEEIHDFGSRKLELVLI